MSSTGNAQPAAKSLINLNKSMSSPRTLFSMFMTGLTFFASAIAILPLFSVLVYVATSGIKRLDLELFTKLPPPPLAEGGGVSNAIVGTMVTVAIAVLLSVPFGVLAAVFLSEFARDTPIASAIDFFTNVLSGVPSIVMGVFAYGVVVLTTKSYSPIAGGFALAVLMLPTVVRTAAEAMESVGDDVRQASVGLGATDFQTVSRVVLPAALSGITKGVMLAVARAAGETAPIIFTALFSQFRFNWEQGLLQPIATLSVVVYNFAVTPYPNQQEIASAAALLLVSLVLVANILSRFIVGRSRS